MMDRKGWVGVFVCFGLMLWWIHYSQTKWPMPKKPVQPAGALQTQTTPDLSAGTSPAAFVSADATKLPDETTAVLENEEIRAVFTTHGGAVREIELKKHKQSGTENILLNRDSREAALNLTGWDEGKSVLPYEIQPLGKTVSFRRKLSNGVVLERTYRLEDNYRIVLDQSVSNPGTQPVTLPQFEMNVGTANPVHRYDNSAYITASWMTMAEQQYHKNTIANFDASTIPLIGYKLREARSVVTSDEAPLGWLSVQNQFFTMVLTPPTTHLISKAVLTRGKVVDADSKSTPLLDTIHGEAQFAGFTLKPGETRKETYQFYTGPKEYARLQKLGRHEDMIMDFGMTKVIIIPLLSMMRGIHDHIPSWGWTIIIMTLIIRGFMWPLQAVSNKSMKKMQALQPKLVVLREKYKDNVQKLNEEQMKMFREYGVNPAGGCLPMLVQLPIFIGFYVMLQSVVELRGASFWWIKDLTQPDTLFQIPGLGLNLNPLPLIMTATSVLMMRMTPQTAETQQMKFMQFLPLVFLFILYNFAAALSLYMTVGNFVSIAQTYLNLRQPLPKLEKVPKKNQLSFGRV